MKLHIQTRTSHSKMPLERFIDSKLLCMSDSLTRVDKSSSLGGYIERSGSFHCGPTHSGSLKPTMVKSQSMNSTSSSPTFMSRSSSSASRNTGETSRSESTESVYFDAPNDFNSNVKNHNFKSNNNVQGDPLDSIQICDSVPIASKFLDIFYYSLMGDPNCSHSSLSFMARFMLGKMIER